MTLTKEERRIRRIERYEKNKEKAKKQMRAYYLAHKEELNKKNTEYRNAHKEEFKKYQKEYIRSAEGKAAMKRKEEKRSEKAGTKKQVSHIACSHGMKYLGLSQKEWYSYKKENQLAVHHCFGVEHPDQFVMIPNEIHRKLHSVYGKKNEDVPFKIVAKFCFENSVPFILVGKTFNELFNDYKQT